MVTCTTNGTTVQSWTSSSTSPSTVFSLDASLVNDTIALVNNSMVMFVVHFKAASVEYKMMTSVLSVIVSAKILGTVLQCADNTESYTGVHIASLLFQEFNGKYRKITRCALMKCSPCSSTGSYYVITSHNQHHVYGSKGCVSNCSLVPLWEHLW